MADDSKVTVLVALAILCLAILLSKITLLFYIGEWRFCATVMYIAFVFFVVLAR